MKELQQFKNYILSESTESAKDHYVFPLFQKLFGNKFKKETDAQDALLNEMNCVYFLTLYSGLIQIKKM